MFNLLGDTVLCGLSNFSIGFSKRVMEKYFPFFNASKSSLFKRDVKSCVIDGTDLDNLLFSQTNQFVSSSLSVFDLLSSSKTSLIAF